MPAFVGRDVTVEFAIALETATLGSLSWNALGMMRGKTLNAQWDDVDATADQSPAYTRQNLVTFKMVEFSGDGVTYTDALYNQATFKAQVINPAAGTGNQPKVWLRLTAPDGVTTGPFLVTQWSEERPFDNVATWSIAAKSNGAVTFTPA